MLVLISPFHLQSKLMCEYLTREMGLNCFHFSAYDPGMIEDVELPGAIVVYDAALRPVNEATYLMLEEIADLTSVIVINVDPAAPGRPPAFARAVLPHTASPAELLAAVRAVTEADFLPGVFGQTG